MNPAPAYPTNSLEDSLRNAHEASYRAKNLLDAIWADLTGDEACESECMPSSGIITSADYLATKVSVIADRLESIRHRIASPKVVAMKDAQNSAYGTKGYATPSHY